MRSQRIRHLADDHDQRLAQTQSDSQPGRHQSESDFELTVELLETGFYLVPNPDAECVERSDQNRRRGDDADDSRRLDEIHERGPERNRDSQDAQRDLVGAPPDAAALQQFPIGFGQGRKELDDLVPVQVCDQPRNRDDERRDAPRYHATGAPISLSVLMSKYTPNSSKRCIAVGWMPFATKFPMTLPSLSRPC